MNEMNHKDTKTRSRIPERTESVSKEIVDSAYRVHSQLGPGLLESIYELTKRGLKSERQRALPIVYDGLKLDGGLRMDLVVEECIVVEIKAVETVLPVHVAQVLSYLKLSGMRLGLLITFNVPLIKEGIRRLAN